MVTQLPLTQSSQVRTLILLQGPRTKDCVVSINGIMRLTVNQEDWVRPPATPKNKNLHVEMVAMLVLETSVWKGVSVRIRLEVRNVRY